VNCEDILRWANKIKQKIDALDRATAVTSKQEAAIKQMITGLAKSMESIGLSAELGYSSGGASAKITIKPKHQETVAGGFDVWDGWKKYTEAGGKVPSAAATRRILVKLRKLALDDYQNCRDSEGWRGYVKATFTEQCHKSEANNEESLYEEVHTWVLDGAPYDDDRQSYPATWTLKAEGSAEIYNIASVPIGSIPRTTVSLTAQSRVDISITGRRYEIVCGRGTNVFPNAFTFVQHDYGPPAFDHPPSSLDLRENIVAVNGTKRSDRQIRGHKTSDTAWSFWQPYGRPGVTHRLTTEWSLVKTTI
jgi:hypothetical protein